MQSDMEIEATHEGCEFEVRWGNAFKLNSTYEVYMYTKYQLLALDATCVKLYKRLDVIKSPVDYSLAHHMQTAASRYKKKKASNADGPSAKNAAVSTSSTQWNLSIKYASQLLTLAVSSM